MANSNLTNAKTAKNDEFYTQLSDIEKELQHYKEHFKDKVVFCNCDDPEESNFWKYFSLNFDYLGLKKLVGVHYKTNESTYKLEITRSVDLNNDGKYNNDDLVKTPLKQNGDFRSDESVEILKSCDIVVTNPPFSLFREFIELLMKYEKKFLVIGNNNAVTYKEVFKHIKENRVWLGNNFVKEFRMPEHYPLIGSAYINAAGEKIAKFGNILWFTNLTHNKRNEKAILYRNYNPTDYPKYDNYDAIEVSKVKDIPCDYDGVMGVPITFLNGFNPEQFEILGLDNHLLNNGSGKGCNSINGKKLYRRLIIKKKPIADANTTP